MPLFTHNPWEEISKLSLYYNNSIRKPYYFLIPTTKQNPGTWLWSHIQSLYLTSQPIKWQYFKWYWRGPMVECYNLQYFRHYGILFTSSILKLQESGNALLNFRCYISYLSGSCCPRIQMRTDTVHYLYTSRGNSPGCHCRMLVEWWYMYMALNHHLRHHMTPYIQYTVW